MTILGGTGTTTFTAAVGGTAPLGSLAVTAGAIDLYADLTTGGGILSMTGPITLFSDVSMDTTSGASAGADISLLTSVDGAETLTLNSGTSGSITLGAVGQGVALDAVTITNANSVTTGPITAASLTQLEGGGTTTFDGVLTMTSDISLTGNAFAINQPVAAAINVTIDNAGLLAIDAIGDMDLTGFFLQNGAGLVHTGGNIVTTSGDITFDSGVTLRGPLDLHTPNDIIFGSAINGGFDLVLIADNITLHDIGTTSALNSLRAIASGTIAIGSTQIVSSGPMVYDGAVVLTDNSAFTDTGANGITFTSTITGNHNLAITANSSSITVSGDVDLSGTGGSPGGNLTTSSEMTTTFGGQILVQGGAAGAGGDVTITSTAGSVSVHNINTSAGAGAVGGNIILTPTAGVSGGYPLGLIILNSDLSGSFDGNLVAGAGAGGTGGNITLSANRPSPVEVATIVSSAPGNDISIIAVNCTLGPNEVMTGLGAIAFACTTLTLGDVVALTDLSIVSDTTNLRTHGDETILASNGLPYISPSLHFLGGTGYSQMGALVPADGILNAQDLSLATTEFRPQLFYNDHILNYDTSAKPVPPPPPPSSITFTKRQRQFSVYLLSVADAELSDQLPIFLSEPPYPYDWVECDEHRKHCQRSALRCVCAAKRGARKGPRKRIGFGEGEQGWAGKGGPNSQKVLSFGFGFFRRFSD